MGMESIGKISSPSLKLPVIFDDKVVDDLNLNAKGSTKHIVENYINGVEYSEAKCKSIRTLQSMEEIGI